MKTIADDQAWLRLHLAYPERHPEGEPVPRWARVLAPCCRAECAADSVLDLRGCGGTFFRAGSRHAELDHDAACTGCLFLLLYVSGGGWTLSRIARAHGEPAEVVRHLRALELRAAAEREAGNAERPFDPNAEYERALASLPSDGRAIPGTEPPSPRPRGSRQAVTGR